MSIFVSISHLRIKFLLELNVNYPTSSKKKKIKKSRITHFSSIEVVDTHLLLVSYFMMFIMYTSMEEVFVVLTNLE